MVKFNDKSFGLLAAIIGLIAALIQVWPGSWNFHALDAISGWTTTACLFNIVVMIIFIYMLGKKYSINFKKETGIEDYSRLIENLSNGNEKGNERSNWYHDRVNLIVLQFRNNIIWYCVFLIPVYCLFFAEKGLLNKNFFFVECLGNYLSSLFVFFGFLVLYNKTLDDRNKSDYMNNHYFVTSLIFSLFFVFALVYFIYIADFEILNKNNKLSNRLSLLAGISNGVVMMLLFSRYISIEHVVHERNRIVYSPIITIGILYVFPIYAIVQPLFGSFKNNLYGSPEILANIVITICLFGKLLFLYVTWFLMKNKILHLYLHNIITPHDAQGSYSDCFEI